MTISRRVPRSSGRLAIRTDIILQAASPRSDTRRKKHPAAGIARHHRQINAWVEGAVYSELVLDHRTDADLHRRRQPLPRRLASSVMWPSGRSGGHPSSLTGTDGTSHASRHQANQACHGPGVARSDTAATASALEVCATLRRPVQGQRLPKRWSLARTWSASGWCRSSRMARACCQAPGRCRCSPAAWQVSPRWVRASAW